MIDTVYWENGIVMMLDQTRLPHEVVYNKCSDYKMVAQGIRELWVRGAPAIGIAAAMGIALGVRSIKTDNIADFNKCVDEICDVIGATRPTAVNLFWAINRMKKLFIDNSHLAICNLKELAHKESQVILEEDIAINRAMGRYGANLVNTGDVIHTHCNAGSLATGGYGTALGVVRAAFERYENITVIADETRPVLQGARLTAWELMQDDIPVTLITDNMAGYCMKKGMINCCVVGSDRIASNGDVANKIGTYTVAILAREHNIPFYVAAPISTIDFNIAHGDEIPIEERDHSEVSNVFGKAEIAPRGVRIFNPAFDVTPASLVTAIINEKGAFKPADIYKLSNMDISEEELEQIRIKYLLS